MRKAYIKPTMGNQFFTANEYVSACFNADCSYYYGLLSRHDCPLDNTTIRGNDLEDALNKQNLFHPGNTSHKLGGLAGFAGYGQEESDKYYHDHPVFVNTNLDLGEDAGFEVTFTEDHVNRS